MLTIVFQDDKLAERLKLEGMTLDQFKTQMFAAFAETINAGELCEGATAKIDFRE